MSTGTLPSRIGLPQVETVFSLQFYRVLVILNGAVPAGMLAWDAYHDQLGANSVNYALHVTGILALVFLFLSLLITPLRWSTGWGGWVAFRRSLGLYGFYYALLHGVIYVGFDREWNVSSTLQEIWMRRFLQIGVLAVLLMIPLAVTSTNSMMQRLGSKLWKRLHRLTYVVAALGVLHYYLLVKSDVRLPLAFAGVLSILLGLRLGRHYLELLALSKRKFPPVATGAAQRSKYWNGELVIAAIIQETPEVRTFKLRALDGGALPFDYLPGQYLNLQLEIAGQRVHRSYTIASAPTQRDACELSIKRETNGLASRYLHDQARVGDRLKVAAPAGKFVFTGMDSAAVFLVAGGVGITPLMSVVRYLTDRAWDGDIFFLLNMKTEQDIVFREEIAWLQKRCPRLHVCVTLTQIQADDVWSGERGRPTMSMIQSFVPNLDRLPVYICGPQPMMDATRDLLVACGVSPSNIKTEAFVSPPTNAVDDPADGGLPSRADQGLVDNQSTARLGKSVDSFVVELSISKIKTTCSGSATILEAAEEASLNLSFECRSGICGQCKTRLLAGSVEMETEDALSADEKSRGLILACQARPTSDVVVEA